MSEEVHMLRNSNKKWWLKKKRSTAPPINLDTFGELQTAFNQYEAALHPNDSESVKVFRETFSEAFLALKEETDLLVNGVADISDTWTDILGANGIAFGSAVISGIIGLLGGLLILSAGATAGISIAIAAVGVGLGIAFYKYREWVRQKRLDRATAAMDRDDFEQEVHQITQQLIDMYRLQLESCTVKDAQSLANACMGAITAEMKRNKEFDFEELLYSPSLQNVLVRANRHLPKIRLDMNLLSDKKYNTRGMIKHTAFYVRETDEFYKTAYSKGKKYGVLYFDKKSDLDDYQELLAVSMRKPEQWKLRKMRKYETSALKRSSLFKAYDNDHDFDKQSAIEVVEPGNKLQH